MTSKSFDIHGISISVDRVGDALSDVARRLFGSFPSGSGAKEDFRIELRAVQPPLTDYVSHGARLVLEAGKKTEGMENSGTDDNIHCRLCCEDKVRIMYFRNLALLRLDDERKKAEVLLVDPESMRSDYLAAFIRLAVEELLKLRGVFQIHAAAVERHGRGVLIPGPSGRGKSTAALSLLAGGYRCLTDDNCLFRRRDGRVELLSFVEPLGATEQTLALIPQLRDAPVGEIDPDGKHRLDLEDTFPQGAATSAHASVILLPYIVDQTSSRLERIPRNLALAAILPDSHLLFFSETIREHFRVLAELVRGAACYRLFFGRDVLALPERIDEVIRS